MSTNVYFIEKKIQSGEFEKNSIVLVGATNKGDAQKRALLGECHGSLEDETIVFINDDTVEDMGGEFIYTIRDCTKVDEEDVDTLKKSHRFIF